MPRYRSLVALLILIIIFLCVVLVSNRTAYAPIVEAPDDPRSSDGMVHVHHSFNEGVHTYAFDLLLPSPCSSFSEPEITIGTSSPQKIGIAYTILPPPNGSVCIQVITPVPLSVNVQAPEDAELRSLSVNGSEVDIGAPHEH